MSDAVSRARLHARVPWGNGTTFDYNGDKGSGGCSRDETQGSEDQGREGDVHVGLESSRSKREPDGLVGIVDARRTCGKE